MKNITISVDEKVLEAGREYAKKHDISLNALIRKLLTQTVQPESEDWLDECFLLMDKADAYSDGEKWSREDLYDS